MVTTVHSTTAQHIIFESLEAATRQFAREAFERAMEAGNGPFLALEELLRDRLSPADFRAALRLMEAIDSAAFATFDGAMA